MKTRLQFVFTEAATQELDALTALWNMRTRAATLRLAVRVLTTLLTLRAEGKQLVVRGRDGSEQQVLLGF